MHLCLNRYKSPQHCSKVVENLPRRMEVINAVLEELNKLDSGVYKAHMGVKAWSLMYFFLYKTNLTHMVPKFVNKINKITGNHYVGLKRHQFYSCIKNSQAN